MPPTGGAAIVPTMNASPPKPEPGDIEPPETEASQTDALRRREEIDHDDLIGFASPIALQGRLRAPAAPVEVEPESVPEPAPETVVAAPIPAIAPRTVTPSQPPAPEPTPAWARETPVSEQPAGGFARRREQPAPIEGAMGVYSVYALILFAVPTLGVSALIALFAVTGRAAPANPITASHFVFQQRTLWAGAVVALLGGILIAVGLGVFVLFLLAVWLILRGAGGVLKLKAGRPIERPRAWLF